MQSTLTEFLQDRVLLRHIIATVILFMTVAGLRFATLRFIRRRLPSTDKLQLRLAAQVRGFSYAILAVGLFIIWAAELQALAVSFAVLAMAIVWATRETFACIQGAAYRISANAFEVGDRINIAGIRGDVIDPGILGTLVFEVGQGHQRTGRMMLADQERIDRQHRLALHDQPRHQRTRRALFHVGQPGLAHARTVGTPQDSRRQHLR